MDGRKEGHWRGEGSLPQLLWEEEEYLVYCQYGVDGAAAGGDGGGVLDWVHEAEGKGEVVRVETGRWGGGNREMGRRREKGKGRGKGG